MRFSLAILCWRIVPICWNQENLCIGEMIQSLSKTEGGGGGWHGHHGFIRMEAIWFCRRLPETLWNGGIGGKIQAKPYVQPMMKTSSSWAGLQPSWLQKDLHLVLLDESEQSGMVDQYMKLQAWFDHLLTIPRCLQSRDGSMPEWGVCLEMKEMVEPKMPVVLNADWLCEPQMWWQLWGPRGMNLASFTDCLNLWVDLLCTVLREDTSGSFRINGSYNYWMHQDVIGVTLWGQKWTLRTVVDCMETSL